MSNKLGELAEQLFTVRAIQEGFRVSRPIGHASPYDFIIEKEGKLFRIQVKSNSRDLEKGRNTLHVNTCKISSRGRDNYGQNAFDYYAIYLRIADSFYLIPQNKVLARSVRLHPEPNESHKYFPYFKNWRLH